VGTACQVANARPTAACSSLGEPGRSLIAHEVATETRPFERDLTVADLTPNFR
jgi:hypothetical protein